MIEKEIMTDLIINYLYNWQESERENKQKSMISARLFSFSNLVPTSTNIFEKLSIFSKLGCLFVKISTHCNGKTGLKRYTRYVRWCISMAT